MNRGGAGRNGDGTFPPGDGRGCPYCGQIRGGGHGGGCPNVVPYGEDGLPVNSRDRRWREGQDGPVCSCGFITVVRRLPNGRWIAMCLGHTNDGGLYQELPDSPYSLPERRESD